jgi:hypothetical protein
MNALDRWANRISSPSVTTGFGWLLLPVTFLVIFASAFIAFILWPDALNHLLPR